MQKERHSYLLDLITQRYFLWRQEINLTIADIYKQNVFIYQTWHSSIWTSLAFKGSLTMIHFKVIQQGRFFNILMVVGLANEIEHCLDNSCKQVQLRQQHQTHHSINCSIHRPQTPPLHHRFLEQKLYQPGRNHELQEYDYGLSYLSLYQLVGLHHCSYPVRVFFQHGHHTTITAKQAFNDDW